MAGAESRVGVLVEILEQLERPSRRATRECEVKSQHHLLKMKFQA